MSMEIRLLTSQIGAEIFGVDASRPLADDTVAGLRRALLQHLVIFLRDQALTPEVQLSFARHFGEPDTYPFVRGLEGHPEITPVLKGADETVNFGGIWHSDTSYLPEPPMATVLYARELPAVGGDTLFANQYLAYETLSPPLRQFLDGLTAINSAGKGVASATRTHRINDTGDGVDDEDMRAEHPAVRRHPETGRRALFVNVGHTVRFKDMTEAESEPILDYLFRHQVRPEFCCRFRWQPGSLALWDNRCAQHNPVNDYHGYRRELHRITLKGDRPRGPGQGSMNMEA